MNRSRSLTLTGLMAISGVSLTACGDQPNVAIADQGVIPLYYQINIWGLRKGLAFEPRADEYTLAHSVRPAP